MIDIAQTPVETGFRRPVCSVRVRLLSASILYLVTGLSAFTSFAMTPKSADAAVDQSLFQDVFWNFYLHNADSVSNATAAAYYGYVFESPGSQSPFCRDVRSALDSNNGAYLIDDLRRRLRRFAVNHTSSVSHQKHRITYSVSDGYRQYDSTSQILHVDLLKHVSRPMVVSIRDDFKAEDQPICREMLSLPASVDLDYYPLPTLFRLNVNQALQKLSSQTSTGNTLAAELVELARLSQVSIDNEYVRAVRARPAHRQTLDVDILFSLTPRSPYRETDAQGRKNKLVTHPDGVVEFSLPTHRVRIHQLDYRDGETGTLHASKSVKQKDEDYFLATTTTGFSVNFEPVTKTNIEQLPKGLILRNGAVLVRADDAIVGRTSVTARLSLNRLNQRLGLSAGLPDLSDAEGGILVGDLLDSQADQYFTFSDLTHVQAFSYTKQNAYQEEGYPVVTGWKQSLGNNIKQRFLDEAVPKLRQMTLRLPIDFLELREIYVRPYDRIREGFPLLLRNTAQSLRVSDIRKPGVILDARINDDFPTYWLTNYARAENFIADYYRHNPVAGNKDSSLKTITLASRYRLHAIAAVNGKASSQLKLLSRGLFLDDDATLLLEELKVSAARR